eukprot:14396950-Alexandrium_andersonii.AAC.1
MQQCHAWSAVGAIGSSLRWLRQGIARACAPSVKRCLTSTSLRKARTSAHLYGSLTMWPQRARGPNFSFRGM